MVGDADALDDQEPAAGLAVGVNVVTLGEGVAIDEEAAGGDMVINIIQRAQTGNAMRATISI